MFVIFNNTNDKPSMTTIMSINTNIVSLVVHPFLAKRDTKFKVLWSQLRSLEYKYPPNNIFENVELLA